MSDRVRSNIAFFSFVSHPETAKGHKQYLIKHLTKEQLMALGELSINVLKGNISISTEWKDKLKRFSKRLRVLGSPSATIAQRRAVITVPLVECLLGATLSIIAS